MRALQYLLRVHNFGAGRFMSIEQPGKAASNSEVRRWINQGVMQVNDVAVKVDDWIDLDEVNTIKLFPRNRHKTVTLI